MQDKAQTRAVKARLVWPCLALLGRLAWPSLALLGLLSLFSQQRQARPDKARQGQARQGQARQGQAMQGKARPGQARLPAVVSCYLRPPQRGKTGQTLLIFDRETARLASLAWCLLCRPAWPSLALPCPALPCLALAPKGKPLLLLRTTRRPCASLVLVLKSTTTRVVALVVQPSARNCKEESI